MDKRYPEIKKGIRSINSFADGLHWVYVNGKYELSIVCHRFSYGHEVGRFEILPSWRKPSENDDVLGHLSFGDVQKWIDELMSLDGDMNE